MKSYTKKVVAGFILSLLLGYAGTAQTEEKKGRFEFDLGVLSNIPLKAHTSLTGPSVLGDNMTVKTDNHPAFGLNATFGYSIRLSKPLRLVMGISYMLLTERSTRTEDGNIVTFNTVNYYGGYQGYTVSNDPFHDRATLKTYNHCASLNAGLRWQHNKLNVENGLSYLYVIRQYEKATFTYSNGIISSYPLRYIYTAGFIQSYHKIGYDLTKHLGVYLGINLIYAKKIKMTTVDYSYGADAPISGIQFLPSLSLKLKL